MARETMMLLPAALVTRLIRHLPPSLVARLSRALMLGLPDRVVLERRVIPMLLRSGARDVLFIGVASYNAHQPKIFATNGVEFWTIDIDPIKARWGSPGRHVIGDALELLRYFPSRRFDAVVFNGVLGYGIDDNGSANRAFRAIAAVLQPDGTLVVGWNHDKAGNPAALPAVKHLFRQCPMLDGAAHVEIDDCTHMYDFFQRLA